MITLPSGTQVRGRSLRAAEPGGLAATWTVQLGAKKQNDLGGAGEWIPWRDFWLPSRPEQAIEVLRRALSRARTDRVEVGCSGGIGRTGTALAAVCVLEGAEPDMAVVWVRNNYHPRAVEVFWQRRFVRQAAAAGGSPG